MSVYVTATYDIVDPDAYQGYVSGVLPLLQRHGALVLAADFGAQALEENSDGARATQGHRTRVTFTVAERESAAPVSPRLTSARDPRARQFAPADSR